MLKLERALVGIFFSCTVKKYFPKFLPYLQFPQFLGTFNDSKSAKLFSSILKYAIKLPEKEFHKNVCYKERNVKFSGSIKTIEILKIADVYYQYFRIDA